jgi:hypothetical protein
MLHQLYRWVVGLEEIRLEDAVIHSPLGTATWTLCLILSVGVRIQSALIDAHEGLVPHTIPAHEYLDRLGEHPLIEHEGEQHNDCLWDLCAAVGVGVAGFAGDAEEFCGAGLVQAQLTQGDAILLRGHLGLPADPAGQADDDCGNDGREQDCKQPITHRCVPGSSDTAIACSGT